LSANTTDYSPSGFAFRSPGWPTTISSIYTRNGVLKGHDRRICNERQDPGGHRGGRRPLQEKRTASLCEHRGTPVSPVRQDRVSHSWHSTPRQNVRIARAGNSGSHRQLPATVYYTWEKHFLSPSTGVPRATRTAASSTITLGLRRQRQRYGCPTEAHVRRWRAPTPVTLTVTDDEGKTSMAQTSVTVKPAVGRCVTWCGRKPWKRGRSTEAT